MSNHPDLVGILPILLENPESRPICDRDRKNPDFHICVGKNTRTPKRVRLMETDHGENVNIPPEI